MERNIFRDIVFAKAFAAVKLPFSYNLWTVGGRFRKCQLNKLHSLIACFVFLVTGNSLLDIAPIMVDHALVTSPPQPTGSPSKIIQDNLTEYIVVVIWDSVSIVMQSSWNWLLIKWVPMENIVCRAGLAGAPPHRSSFLSCCRVGSRCVTLYLHIELLNSQSSHKCTWSSIKCPWSRIRNAIPKANAQTSLDMQSI